MVCIRALCEMTTFAVWIGLFLISIAQGDNAGKSFLVIVIQTDNTNHQKLMLTNNKDFEIEVISTSSINLNTEMITLPCRHTVNYDVNHILGQNNSPAVLFLNSTFDFEVQGFLHHLYENHVIDVIRYDIMSTSELGKFYRPSLFLSQNFQNVTCAVASLHENTMVLYKKENESVRVQHIARQLGFLQYEIDSQNDVSINISSNSTIAVFCGAQNPTNEVRLHIPVMDYCGTDFFIPSYNPCNATGLIIRRVIRMILTHPSDLVSSTFLQNHNMTGKRFIEIDNFNAFNISSPNKVCVLQGLRRWDPSNTTFVDENFRFLRTDTVATDSAKTCFDRHSSIPGCGQSSCLSQPTMLTPQEREKRLNNSLYRIKKELSVKRSDLSATKRKKISAHDGRPSATGLGVIGVIVLVVIVLIIAACDLPLLTTHIRKQKEKTSILCSKS